MEQEIDHDKETESLFTTACRTIRSMISVLLFTRLIGIALPVHAALIEDIKGSCDFTSGKIDAECVPVFIAHLIQQIFMFTGAICLIMIMIGAYQLVLGRSIGAETSKGQSTITWGLIGFIAAALSFFIVDFIISSLAGI